MTGCHGLGKKHEANRIPQFGTIDPNQPGELRKVSQSAYIIEPPDELEITAQPPFPELGQSTFVVQADGNVDLGFAGDAYVSGLTLAEAEERIAVQLNDAARNQTPKPDKPYRVVGQAGDRPEQVLLRARNRGHAGQVQGQRQRHRPGCDPSGRPEIEQPAREGLSGSSSSAWGSKTRFTRSTGSASRTGATR